MKIGWKPRRLGGGYGGNKKSGQCRFGGRLKGYNNSMRKNQNRNPYITLIFTHIQQTKQ